MKERIISKVLKVIVFVSLALFGLSAVVMFLWNEALVPATNLNTISYWQAMGILALSKILFTGFGSKRKHGGPPWRRKWKNMNAEDREKLKERWKARCENGK